MSAPQFKPGQRVRIAETFHRFPCATGVVDRVLADDIGPVKAGSVIVALDGGPEVRRYPIGCPVGAPVQKGEQCHIHPSDLEWLEHEPEAKS